jgi:hypothetical protein
MWKTLVIAAALLLAPSAARAELASVGDNGFSVRHMVTTPVPPGVAYLTFLKVRTWWSKEHTFSGDPENLSIDVRPGGCWCERLRSGGFVRHMELVYAAPGRTLVFAGALGPLQAMGVSGAMTVRFEPEGKGAKVTMLYNVSGYAPKGWREMAPSVDAVLGEQMARYAKRAAGQTP